MVDNEHSIKQLHSLLLTDVYALIYNVQNTTTHITQIGFTNNATVHT